MIIELIAELGMDISINGMILAWIAQKLDGRPPCTYEELCERVFELEKNGRVFDVK